MVLWLGGRFRACGFWCKGQKGYIYLQKCGLVNLKLKWVKDKPLDKTLAGQREVKTACFLVSIISFEFQGYVPIYHLRRYRGQLGLPDELKLSSFMRRYPTLFHESSFLDSGGTLVPSFSLSLEALSIHWEEQDILKQNQNDTINRLCKLLMLMRDATLPLQTIDQLKWDLGLPFDYHKTLIPHFPQLFSFVDLDDGRVGLKLLVWDDCLAVSHLQKNVAVSNEGLNGESLAFPISFTRGFGLKRKCMKWLEEWQKLPYTSPYCDASHLDPRTDVSEKRIVGVFHELLHLTIHKQTERKNVSNLRKPLCLPQKFTKVFERHPGIFYISMKNDSQTVVLRDGYYGSELLEKHPLVEIRQRYAEIMAQGFLDRSRGLYRKTDKSKVDEGQAKLIGARFYSDPDSETTVLTARDELGHGTHVASTAAGSAVPNASYYGLASGTAKGGSPTSHIAMYRVCSSFGCPGSAIVAAFDDAIADGVNLLSLSLGATAESGPDFSADPIAIGSFHAVQKGITVLCSAGNDGRSSQTVVNVAPWILTVAATTIDRDLQSDLVLGNNVVIKGESINFSELEKSPVYPLVSGVSAKSSTATEDSARKCYPESLDAEKIKGKIVLCTQNNSEISMKEKLDDLMRNKAAGVAFVSDIYRLVASNWGTAPATVISSKESMQILEYINSTSNPVATILPTETVSNYKPAPTVAYFSSRGPSYATKNILKPDIAAPGVNILAAWIANDTKEGTTPSGKKPPKFNVISGTSMACPHAAGIAANVKARNPTWSPAAVRSSIMTTAIQTNNQKEAITTHSGEVATPFDYGAGEISPTGGLQPGLVYDTDPADYLQFLCYVGYDLSAIKLVAGEIPTGFSCPKNSSADMIWNLNYPSVAVSKNVATTPVTVTRTVTNVDSDDAETTYTVTVDAPKELEVNVEPKSLKFTANTKKLSYQVKFAASSANSIKGNVFGAIILSNQKHQVRSPFVVSSE